MSSLDAEDLHECHADVHAPLRAARSAKAPGDARTRDILIRATLDAIARCTPVRITPALGGAIAGRPLALRFIYDGPRGQGI